MAAPSQQARQEQSAAGEPRQLPGGFVSCALPWLVVAAAFVAYLGTLWFEFTFDDAPQIVQNALIQSWKYVPGYFTSHVWSFMVADAVGNYYRPVFLLWLRLNHALFGLKPMGWHLGSVLLHVTATFLVFRLAARVLKDRAAALFAALIFGLHPAHIEAVAWVSGATDPLVSVFLLGAAICFERWREGEVRKRGALAASLVLFALGALSKEPALVLPGILFVTELERDSSDSTLPRQRFRRAAIVLAPFLAVTAGYLVARVLALRGFSHVQSNVDASTIALTLPSVVCFYAAHLFWPLGLSVFYDTPYVTHATLGGFFLPAIAVAGLVAILAVFWRRSSHKSAVAISAAWLIFPLLPVFDLRALPPGEFAHDRYLYLPSIGFVMLIALGWKRAVSRWSAPVRQVFIQAASAAALTVALGGSTIHQSAFWANDLLLYFHGHQVAPLNDLAQNNLANVMADLGMYDGAIKLYKEILTRNPKYWRADFNLGWQYARLGRFTEAEDYLSKALALGSTEADEYAVLGFTRFGMGRLDDAEALLRHAIAIRPAGLSYHSTLGAILKAKGDLKGALAESKTELEYFPGSPAARRQIAELEAALRDGSGGARRGRP